MLPKSCVRVIAADRYCFFNRVCFTDVTCRVYWCTYYSIIAGDKRLDAVHSERTVSLPMQHSTRQCLLVRRFWRITVTISCMWIIHHMRLEANANKRV